MDKLTGHDYLHMPLIELSAHPDFNEEAFNKAALFLSLTTEDILNVIIPTKGS